MRVKEGDISGLNHQVGTRAQEVEEEKLLQDLETKGGVIGRNGRI